MARQRRADEAGGIYHALNRGNRRATIFHTDEDYWAFENILSEGLERYRVEIFSYELMPNHFHLILRPGIDGEMGRFMKWVGGTHTTRYNFHYKAVGQGHVYQQRFKSFPIEDDSHFYTACRYVERNALRAGLVETAGAWRWGSLNRWLHPPERCPQILSPWPMARPEDWLQRVNTPLTDNEMEAIRKCAQRGQPFGSQSWIDQLVQRLGLPTTKRPRGRPRKATISKNET